MFNTFRQFAVALLFIFAAVTAPPAAEPGPTEPAYLYRAIVVRVIDGDTIDVDIDLGFYVWLKNQRIRLAGIDAPEMRGAERTQGRRSATYLRSMIEGKEIILKTIKGRDGADRRGKFGRWIGRVYLDGQDINRHMIEAGHAKPY